MALVPAENGHDGVDLSKQLTDVADETALGFNTVSVCFPTEPCLLSLKTTRLDSKP